MSAAVFHWLPPPPLVEAEGKRRLAEAERAYEVVKPSCDLLGMTREQYIVEYLRLFPPLVWASSTTNVF